MQVIRYGLGALLVGLWVAPLGAQETGIIRGRVTNQASQPIQGVTISVGSRLTITRADGRYQIGGVPVGSDTLRARMIGYSPVAQTFTMAAGQTLDLDFTLVAQAINLEEIVVVGYGEQAGANITGAVSNVSSEEFNPGRVVNPTELIQNKVAGVQVIENNEPGGGTSVRVRGTTSTSASSEPLYVVDGVPLGAGGGISTGRSPLNFINADDIENITVLRDASAASIYGANAASGVILITTKRGSGAPRFEYSGSFSSSSIDKLPTMLNAQQFRAAVTQFAPTKVAQLGNSTTDWFDLVDRTAFGQEQNIALSGSTNSMSYRLSANYLDQEGVIEGTNQKRIALGLNYNQALFNDRLNLKVSVRGSRSKEQFTPGGVISNAAQMGPTQPVIDTAAQSGFANWDTLAGGGAGGIQSADNPVEILRLARNEGNTLRSVGNVQVGYQLPYVQGLTANVNIGYDVTKASQVSFSPSVLHAQVKNKNFGNYFRQDPYQLSSVIEPYLDWVVPRSIGPGQLELTAGYSYSSSHQEFPTTSADSLSTDLLGISGIPSAKFINSTQFFTDSKLISFFGRANYNIKDRYLLNASLRRDGSSRFGPGNQWGTFPSVAAAWRISEESFMPKFWGLSDMKLRASWAQTGNQSFSDYLWSSTYTVGDGEAQYFMGSGYVTTIRPSAVDPNIKWEATRSLDFGLDFGFQNGRFSGAIDWYDKKTTDLIFSVPAAAGTVPGDFITTNLGSVRNRGIEFSLSAQILRGGSTGRGLRWTADINAAHNRNELLTITPFGGATQQILVGGIAGGVGQTIQVLKPGVAVNSFFVYQQNYDSQGKPIEGSYKDLNNDGLINQNDLRPFHDPAPKWILGHSSYMTYGNFDASFTLRAYLGNYVYNNVASNLGSYQELNRGSPYNLHASVLETGFTAPQYFSDFYVEDASFLRMDNITLGYSFSLRGQSARVFGTLQNAFTITGYSGVDPTAGLNGIDNNLYPRSRTLSGGLSLRF
jgi:TonB-linked SusC/RagA family outer membrane protein